MYENARFALTNSATIGWGAVVLDCCLDCCFCHFSLHLQLKDTIVVAGARFKLAHLSFKLMLLLSCCCAGSWFFLGTTSRWPMDGKFSSLHKFGTWMMNEPLGTSGWYQKTCCAESQPTRMM